MVVHSLVVGLLVPVMTILPWYQAVAVSLSKRTSQPASQSCPMEMRLVFPRAGKMWAVLLSRDKPGMWMAALCVEVIVEPSGIATWMPWLVGCLSLCSELGHRNWPVVPVSIIDCVGGGEGASVCVVTGFSLLALCVLVFPPS